MKSFNLAQALAMPQLDSYLEQVEQGLKQSVEGAATTIRDPALRMIQAGGKRLRPALTLAVAAHRAVGLDERAVDLSVAVELVHIGSLVHDDVIDRSPIRRSTPTINGQEGVSAALLVGDYLFAKACSKAATVDARAGRLIADTITMLCNGESRELAAQGKADPSLEDAMQIIQDKTAALMAAACQLGAYCSDSPENEVAAYAGFGREFGIAFQLMDDFLDLVSTPELLGKPTGVDLQEGVYTLPLLLALQGQGGLQVREVLARMSPAQPEIARILAQHDVFTQVIQEVTTHNRLAAEALRSGVPGTSSLAEFPNAYLQWVLGNLLPKEYQFL